MFNLLVLYAHLLATCTALGVIVATDLRVLARVRDIGFRLAPPNPFITRLIGASLLLLCVTGAGLIAIGIGEQPNMLANPKLQAKMALVALLVINAGVLHWETFPWLALGKRMHLGSWRTCVGVAAPIALSSSLWFYVAFLGVARPWNDVVPAPTVLAIAATLSFLAWLGVMATIHAAVRQQRRRQSLAPAFGGRRAWSDTAAVRAARDAVNKARLLPPRERPQGQRSAPGGRAEVPLGDSPPEGVEQTPQGGRVADARA